MYILKAINEFKAKHNKPPTKVVMSASYADRLFSEVLPAGYPQGLGKFKVYNVDAIVIADEELDVDYYLEG